MKGDKTLKLLEILKDVVFNTADYLDAFLISGYGSSFDEMRRNALRGEYNNGNGCTVARENGPGVRRSAQPGSTAGELIDQAAAPDIFQLQITHSGLARANHDVGQVGDRGGQFRWRAAGFHYCQVLIGGNLRIILHHSAGPLNLQTVDYRGRTQSEMSC